MKNNLFVIFLIFSCLLNIVDADILSAQSLKNNAGAKEMKAVFQRLDTQLIPNKLQINFYPVADGDFWEYITADTTTLLGQFYDRLNFSITKEITGDTLMTNGITYKKVRWENIANSVNYPVWYDYHRVDTTGNVHLFYEGSDYLLFDFSLPIGQIYPSHLPNHIWKIADRYNVIGFGDTLQAIDFELLEQGTILKEKYTVVENFGIVYYLKNIDGYLVPEGNFWGAVINREEYGTLIATKQTVDWSEFYPLHIGDYWVYEGQNGSIPTSNTVHIIGDTVMSDGYLYFISLSINQTFRDTSFSYRRIDTLGNVFYWDYYSNILRKILTFSQVVGDSTNIQNTMDILRIDDKYINNDISFIEYLIYPSLIYYKEIYAQGLGLYDLTIEGNSSILIGAYINGYLYGDTTLTGIDDRILIAPNEFILYQEAGVCLPD